MATIKRYTDISQSKKLAEILPLESADMYYCYGMDIHTKVWSFDDTPTIIDNSNRIDVNADIPCWSLEALLSVLPSATLDSSNDHYYRLGCMERFTEWHDNAVDACVAMIERLHKLKIM